MNRKIKIIIGILVILSICWIGYNLVVPGQTNDDGVYEQRDSVKGIWHVVSMSNQEEVISEEEIIVNYGGEFVYEFISDSIVNIGVGNSKEECAYTQEGSVITITFNENITTLTMLDDDTMVIDSPDIQIQLMRQ